MKEGFQFPAEKQSKKYLFPIYLLSLLFNVDQMAAVAALCVQYEADFRPNMTIVVKALQPLLNAANRPAADAQA